MEKVHVSLSLFPSLSPLKINKTNKQKPLQCGEAWWREYALETRKGKHVSSQMCWQKRTLIRDWSHPCPMRFTTGPGGSWASWEGFPPEHLLSGVSTSSTFCSVPKRENSDLRANSLGRPKEIEAYGGGDNAHNLCPNKRLKCRWKKKGLEK